MNKPLQMLHPNDHYIDGYDTGEYDKKNNNSPFRIGPACPQDAFHPAWCHEQGGLRVKGPDGLDYPARAFGPAGPFTAEDFEAGFCGVWNDDYYDGATDGREGGECLATPSCAPCSTYATCASVSAKLAEPAQLTGKLLLVAAPDPALDGTSLEGNFGDLCLAPATDAADPLVVGIVEVPNTAYVKQEDGTYALEQSLSSIVCASVGVDYKQNGVAAAPAEGGEQEGEG